MGNKLTEILPDGTVLRYTYDSKNRIVTALDEKGITTAYTYDADGNITKKELSIAVYNGASLLVEKIQISEVTTYTYDGGNRLKRRKTN